MKKLGLHTLVVLVLAVSIAAPAEQVLFQSGTIGSTGITIQQQIDEQIPGTNVNAFVFVGARFELKEPVITSRIGGHFTAGDGPGGDFFGAIVSLDGPDDLPDSSDLSMPDVLGDTLLTFPEPSADVFGELELELQPGWYGVVFGSGLFGATGVGATINNNFDVGAPELHRENLRGQMGICSFARSIGPTSSSTWYCCARARHNHGTFLLLGSPWSGIQDSAVSMIHYAFRIRNSSH